MSGVCEFDDIRFSGVERTRKEQSKIVRERICKNCNERYKTVEEREDVRFEMKRMHEEEIRKLRFENQELRDILINAAEGITVLVNVWKEAEKVAAE